MCRHNLRALEAEHVLHPHRPMYKPRSLPPSHFPRQISYIYKLAKLSIQEITPYTRIQMLKHFLQPQDIDVALLQEITMSHLNGI